MAGNITVAIVIILIIGGIIFGCWVDRADTKIADEKKKQPLTSRRLVNNRY